MLPEAFLARPMAHRALHDLSLGRPENTRAAVQAAVDAGYGIEIDLQLSADGQAMVFHDYDLARLTGVSGAVRQRAAKALARLTVLGSAEAIPTLSEVLEIVAAQVPLVIELKDQDGAMGPDIGPLEQATAAALAGYSGDAALMSFNPHSVAALARLCPERPLGLTTCAARAEDFPTLSAKTRGWLAQMVFPPAEALDFISHHHTDLINPKVAALKAQGLSVLCWTIRSPEEEARARGLADNVTFEGYAA